MARAYSVKDSDDSWQPFEVGVVKWLRRDDDVQAGIWACKVEEQPEAHEVTFERNETVLILEGRVRVEVVDGPTLELAAGDTASFVKGTVGRWYVLDDVREFFVYA